MTNENQVDTKQVIILHNDKLCVTFLCKFHLDPNLNDVLINNNVRCLQIMCMLL